MSATGFGEARRVPRLSRSVTNVPCSTIVFQQKNIGFLVSESTQDGKSACLLELHGECSMAELCFRTIWML